MILGIPPLPGLVFSYTGEGFIHILPALTSIVVPIRVIHRKPIAVTKSRRPSPEQAKGR